ncbi:hypothetical protein [Jannaschia formosa]|uniref:hypothetical protein n=1 Tax=Jannaschia formosa TaxID=2259592 RepID=UPI000E1BCDA7|nr:hypothetical protein [Jannaschia formosa]TFL19868.1 hypothetical protein DR046_00530 [Jannaschia formosa]
MLTPLCFLRDESGAVTVDYTVLVAGGAAVALATLAVLGGAARDWLRLVEEESVDDGMVSGTWAAAMRDYQPANPVMYSSLIEDFGILTDAELDEIEKFVNDYVGEMQPLAENESDNSLLADLTSAVGYSYMDRVRKRPYGSGANMQEVGRIAVKMGWDNSIITMFGDSET